LSRREHQNARERRAFLGVAVSWCVALLVATEPREGRATPSVADEDASGEAEVEWQEHWPRFRLWQYVTTGVQLGGVLALGVGVGYPSDGPIGGAPLDDPFRDTFRAGTREGRDRARTVGDILFRVMNLYPFVDSLFGAGIAHGNLDVAVQTTLINAQAFSITGLLTQAPQHFIGRARPSVVPCSEDPEYERFCEADDQFAAFPSGHVGIASTGAGLVCAHHEYLPLYGSSIADTAACVFAVSAAGAAGAARLVNDRHWASDIVVAWAVGGLTGYFVPVLLHYRYSDPPGSQHTSWTVTPLASPSMLGVSFTAID
jgi:membrane-associated phospholipid phosphatase